MLDPPLEQKAFCVENIDPSVGLRCTIYQIHDLQGRAESDFENLDSESEDDPLLEPKLRSTSTGTEIEIIKSILIFKFK